MLLKQTFSIIFIIVLLATSGSAHQESWQKIAPVGMTFTILMPSRAVDSMRLILWNDKRDMVHANLYESITQGRRYLAAQLFKTPTDGFAGLSSFENFVAGIEYSFKTRQGEVPASLIFDHDVSSADTIGKQYRVELWKRPGVLRLIGSDKSFYVLMVLGADESDLSISNTAKASNP